MFQPSSPSCSLLSAHCHWRRRTRSSPTPPNNYRYIEFLSEDLFPWLLWFGETYPSTPSDWQRINVSCFWKKKKILPERVATEVRMACPLQDQHQSILAVLSLKHFKMVSLNSLNSKVHISMIVPVAAKILYARRAHKISKIQFKWPPWLKISSSTPDGYVDYKKLGANKGQLLELVIFISHVFFILHV